MITSLPPAVQARLLATGTVWGLAHALEECVCNSLDAAATEIEVEIDAENFSFIVRDNGTGITPASLQHLGAAHATSKPSCLEQLEAGPGTLGFRGQALAAICGTAVVEVTSRARGSFETHRKVQSGGATLKTGLALEQRPRPGTTVHVRDLLFNQPVRRKALTAAGLHREVGRCKAAVYHLALLRPGVSFTVHLSKASTCILRLPRGRSMEQSAAEFLGHPPAERIVALGSPAPDPTLLLSGHCVIPPHGYPTAARQACFVNGRPVAVPPVCKLVDTLFQQLYMPNARLLASSGGGGERQLQAVQAAANQHAQFILHIRCSPAAYAIAHEPGKPARVEFERWGPVLKAVQWTVLAAWRPVLSLALLGELGRLESAAREADEGGGAAPAAAGQLDLPASKPASKRSWNGKRSDVGSGKQSLSSRPVQFGTSAQRAPEGAAPGLGPQRGQAPEAACERSQGQEQQKRPRLEASSGPGAAPGPGDWRQEGGQRGRARASAQLLSSTERALLDRAAGPWRCQPRRRGQSAPPHPRRQTRAVHTNPTPSMRTAAARGGLAGIAAWRRRKATGEQQLGKRQQAQAEAALCLPAAAPAPVSGGLWAVSAASAAPKQQQQQRQWQPPPPAAQRPPQQHQHQQRQQQAHQAQAPEALPALGVLLSSWRDGATTTQPAAVEGILDLATITAAAFAPLAPAALTHDQLCAARALRQVDIKFIPLLAGSVLALVDQHAADERVQLELLRARLLQAQARQPAASEDLRSMALGTPLPLLIESGESEILDTYEERVVRWGWAWERDPGSGSLVLTHVPLVFGTALTSTDMKLYLHQLEQTCGAAGLPAAVVRVLNSKACRTAIMFGHALLPVQCQGLVESLAGSELWSCCAHGRPTTSPLVDLAALRRGLATLARARLGVEPEVAAALPTPLTLLKAKLAAAVGRGTV